MAALLRSLGVQSRLGHDTQLKDDHVATLRLTTPSGTLRYVPLNDRELARIAAEAALIIARRLGEHI